MEKAPDIHGIDTEKIKMQHRNKRGVLAEASNAFKKRHKSYNEAIGEYVAVGLDRKRNLPDGKKVRDGQRILVFPIQYRDLSQGHTAAHKRLHAIGKKQEFCLRYVELPHLNKIRSFLRARTQRPRQYRLVLFDERLRRVENGLRGTVIILEIDESGIRKLVFKIKKVFQRCSLKPEYGLLFVPHYEQVRIREKTRQKLQ